MTSYVLDASVAVKWFLGEPDETLREPALAVLESYRAGEVELLVPELFCTEFTNVMRKAERLGRSDIKSSDLAIAEILRRDLRTYPTVTRIARALAISRTHGCSVYDAVYLVVAEETQAPLLTADQRLVRAVAGRLPVVWLGALV